MPTPEIITEISAALGWVRGMQKDLSQGFPILPTSIDGLEQRLAALVGNIQQKDAE